jgi:hypothetical protein
MKNTCNIDDNIKISFLFSVFLVIRLSVHINK